jgi:bifunctional non-homologous end joining protein LigD
VRLVRYNKSMNTLSSTYLEYTYGSSDKFYRISLLEDAGEFSAHIDFGRRGTNGQTTNKYIGPDRAAAEKACNKALAEKLGKGYIEAVDPRGSSAPSSSAPRPTITPPPAPAAGAPPRFPAQLAGENGNLARAIANPRQYVAEEKFDGMRALIAMGPAGDIAIRNREGADKGRIANTPDIAAALTRLANGDSSLWAGTVFDGELVGRSWNETMHLLGSAGRASTDLRYAIFDLPYLAGNDLRGLPWHERRARLEQVLRSLPANSPLFLVQTQTPVAGLAESVWERGGEGLIIKDRNVRYMPGDRNAWDKIKQIFSTEGVIMGFTTGIGKFADTHGAVIMGQYRDGQLVEVVNISGMTDKVRRAMTANDIGRVIEFAYNSKTNTSYRNPRWLRPRPDKDARDCSWEASP